MNNRFSDGCEAVKRELKIEKKLLWRVIYLMDRLRNVPSRLVEHKEICSDCATRVALDMQKELQIHLVQQMRENLEIDALLHRPH